MKKLRGRLIVLGRCWLMTPDSRNLLWRAYFTFRLWRLYDYGALYVS